MGADSAPAQTSRVKFVVDENLGSSIVAGLKLLGCPDYYTLKELGHRGAADHVWIPKLAEKGFVIITKDCRIWRTWQLRKVFLECGAAGFFMDFSSTKWGYSEIIVRRREWMISRVLAVPKPFGFHITQSGRATLMDPKESGLPRARRRS